MFPPLFKKLFANNGAGPLLRQDILPSIPEALLPPLPAATTATATAPGAAGLLALAAGNDTTSWDKAASAAGVAAQIMDALDSWSGGGLNIEIITTTHVWVPRKIGTHLFLPVGAGGGGGGGGGTDGSWGLGAKGGRGGVALFNAFIATKAPGNIQIGAAGAAGVNARDATAGYGGGYTSITIDGQVYAVGGGGGGGAKQANTSAVTPGGRGGIGAVAGANGSGVKGGAGGGATLTWDIDEFFPLIDGYGTAGKGGRRQSVAYAPTAGTSGCMVIIY